MLPVEAVGVRARRQVLLHGVDLEWELIDPRRREGNPSRRLVAECAAARATLCAILNADTWIPAICGNRA